VLPWAASGRAIANGRDEGVTKLLFDDSPEVHGHGKILGGGMVGTHAGDMIGEIALAIEMGADAVDIGKTIHPHPTLGESIGMTAHRTASSRHCPISCFPNLLRWIWGVTVYMPAWVNMRSLFVCS